MCLPLDAISPLPRFYSGLGPGIAYDSDPTSSDSDISPDSDLTFEAITGLTMRGKFIASVTTEFANFDNFREGDSDVTNPGGNKAFIQQTTLFLDYGLTDKFVASFMLPYVSKLQDTNKFGRRSAESVGDIGLFGRREIVSPCDCGNGASIWLGLGVKFPTGPTDNPGNGSTLPPAFQTGSGAYDLVPTLQYYETFDRFSLFGNAFIRFPLEANKIGYRFGNEYEAHFGIDYPMPCANRLSLILSLDYLHAEHDHALEGGLPARLLDGNKVLNSGGQFLDLSPGFTYRLTKKMVFIGRVMLPLYQDWNGDRATDVGQVAPDITTQITLSYIH